MFPKAIVFLFALALAEEAITNRVKREEMDEEDDIDNGKALEETRIAESWNYKKMCLACNDVHGIKFDSEKERIKGVCGKNYLAMDWMDRVKVIIETLEAGPPANKIGDLTILYDGVTYNITMRCKVFVDGVEVDLPYDDGKVRIWAENGMVHWRIKRAFFQVSRSCGRRRCVYVWVAHFLANRMKGICGNNNDIPNDDPEPIGTWKEECVR